MDSVTIFGKSNAIIDFLKKSLSKPEIEDCPLA